ncbi:MAG TPA: Crp/Fnr family transcriptional regulator [Chiayiivirga sp.]|nr:Crp/Fnr family transcriptional regulator [Chiayiivirga sp.]
MTTAHVLPNALEQLLPPALRAATEDVPLNRGDRMFRQGQRPRWMYFVTRGEVVLERVGEQGEAVVLQRVGHGFLAEASLEAAAYHCDARVTGSGQAVALPLERMRVALVADASFALRWIGMLNGEVRRLRARCERLSLKGVEARLVHLVESEGVDGNLPLPSGLKALAAELAVTHEALYRTVGRLERAGTVVRDGTRLTMRRHDRKAHPPQPGRDS